MQVTREDLNACTVKLTIVCDPDEVKAGFDKAYKQMAKQVKLPGFRPGHAPRAMLEKVVQKNELYDQAADNIVRVTFKAAIAEQGLEPDPTTRPSVELNVLDQDENKAEFSAKVPLPPKVSLGDYNNLPVVRQPLDVSESEIDQQIDAFRKRQQTREVVTDRGVEEGDVAVVNIKVDGEEGEGRNFMIIAGQTFAQLDATLAAMHVEEMKSLDLEFPANFQEKDWAGKTLHAKVTVNSLSTVKLPSLDDDFAKSLQAENIDQLRTRMREALGQAKLQMTTEMLHEQLLDKLHERSDVNVSDNMWEALAARRLQETAEEQRKNNKTLEQYSAENGMTVDQLIEAWKEKAKLHVERALLIREVFSAEQMQLTNDELNKELYAMAAEYGIGPEEMLNLLRQNEALDELQFRSISRKVGDFLLSKAAVSEEGETPAAKPAKAAAKPKAEKAEKPAAAEKPAKAAAAEKPKPAAKKPKA